MMNIGINVKFQEIPNRPQKMKEIVNSTIAYAANKLEIEMKAAAPVMSGRLQSSIRQGVLPDGRWVGPKTPYDIYVEFGTGQHSPWGPHYIYPKKGKFLVWTNKAGQTIFARKTRGQKAQPYVRPAVDKMKKTVPPFMVREYRRVMKATKTSVWNRG